MTPNLLTEQLLSFLTDLRQEGYIIGVGQLVAVERLIFALAERGELPENPQDLKTYIAPLICQSPEEQIDFYQRFEQFVLPVTESQAHFSEHTEQVIKQFQWREKLWKSSFWLVLLGLLIVAGVYRQEIQDYFYPPEQPIEVERPTENIDKPVEPEPVIQNPKPNQIEQPTPDITTPTSEPIPVWIYLVAGLLLLSLMGWLWRWNQQAFLKRKLPTSPPDIKQLFIKPIDSDLFPAIKLSRSSQQLRKHIDVPSQRLDIEASLNATLNNAGFFVPIYATRKQSPEYLILVDRVTFKDHHSYLVDDLLKRLRDEGLYFERLYFDADPRRCYAENDSQPISLQALASRYPEHRLLIFSDAQGLIDPLTGQLAGWVSQLFDWEQRSVLMFSAEVHLQYRQQLLQGVDFMVVPANEQGLAALAAQWQAEPVSLQAAELQRYPRYLLLRPRRVLERHPLDKDELVQLMAQLEQYLDDDGLLWLAACAIYPEVKWQLTVYLGQQLDVLSATRLGQLAKLPWLRYGYMPDWLRKALIARLSKQQDKQIREVLAALLISDKSEFKFDVALPKGAVATVQWMLKRWVKQVDSLDELRDTVFISFMQNRLSVRLPRVWLQIIGVKNTFWSVISVYMMNFILSIWKFAVHLTINIKEIFSLANIILKQINSYAASTVTIMYGNVDNTNTNSGDKNNSSVHTTSIKDLSKEIEKEDEQFNIEGLPDYLQKEYDFSMEETLLLQNKIDSMSKEDKLLLKMKYMTGLTQQQISDTLGISVSTVNRRLQKILETLRVDVTETEKKSLQVLIVDDERLIREDLSHYLRHKKYQTLTAVNCEQALEQTKQYQPEFIIIDIGFNFESTCINLLIWIMEYYPEIQPLILSPYTPEEIRKRVEQLTNLNNKNFESLFENNYVPKGGEETYLLAILNKLEQFEKMGNSSLPNSIW